MANTNYSPSDLLRQCAFVRLSQLASKPDKPGLIGISAATLWRWVGLGVFPKPVKLSAGVTAWRAEDVRAWMAQQGGAQ